MTTLSMERTLRTHLEILKMQYISDKSKSHAKYLHRENVTPYQNSENVNGGSNILKIF